MHPKSFQEAQAAIRIFEKHGFIVDSTMPQWIVKYSNGNIYDQFKDSHSMYCAAVGYDEGFNSAGISNYVSAEEVSDMLWHIRDDDIICAALLHDVLEDTNATYKDILELFGVRVANLVQELTDQYVDTSYGNREKRKALEASRLAQTSPDAQTIKCADLISNSKDIVAYDRNFAKTYLKEKQMYLDVMRKANPMIREQAVVVLEVALNQI